MTAAQVLRTLKAIPFEPFEMHLVDGRSIVVRHPELVNLIAGGRLAKVTNRDRLDEVVDVLMIVSLRPLTKLEIRRR